MLVSWLHGLHDPDTVPLLQEGHESHHPEDNDDKNDEKFFNLDRLSYRHFIFTVCSEKVKKKKELTESQYRVIEESIKN